MCPAHRDPSTLDPPSPGHNQRERPQRQHLCVASATPRHLQPLHAPCLIHSRWAPLPHTLHTSEAECTPNCDHGLYVCLVHVFTRQHCTGRHSPSATAARVRE